MRSAAEIDDHTRSPAAKRRRRRFNGMRAAIIMAAAYKGAAGFRQFQLRHSNCVMAVLVAAIASLVAKVRRAGSL